MTNKDYSEQLERIIDAITLPQVLDLISNICYEKAQHLAENWQDNRSAKLWEKNGNLISKTSPKIYS